MLRNRLGKVFRHLSKQAKREGVHCYRLYDHDIPEFPFCIELYEDSLYVAEYKRRHGMNEEEHENWIRQCIALMEVTLAIPGEKIFLRLRRRKAGRLGQYQRLEEAGKEFVVEENGLKFIVNLSDYLDTGLFLDHRITRQQVREECRRKKVLNLFAYTGSFSVYAAAGGAAEVTSVDLSKTYLGWAERNMVLNGFTDGHRYPFIHADVLQYLEKIPPGYFDIIILDPPTFSNSQRMEMFLDIQRDHAALIQACGRALHGDGSIYFSNNLRNFKLEKDKLAEFDIRDISRATEPFDFKGKLNRCCFLIRKKRNAGGQ